MVLKIGKGKQMFEISYDRKDTLHWFSENANRDLWLKCKATKQNLLSLMPITEQIKTIH